jgi:hypothetical protein
MKATTLIALALCLGVACAGTLDLLNGCFAYASTNSSVLFYSSRSSLLSFAGILMTQTLPRESPASTLTHVDSSSMPLHTLVHPTETCL